MEKLNVKAAIVSGAVASGVLHALFGIAYLGTPSMMMYNSVQFGMGAFSPTAYYGLGTYSLEQYLAQCSAGS